MTDLFDDARFRAGACTAAARALEPAILADAKITRVMLNEVMIGAYGGTDAEGRWTQRESFEVLEHAIALAMRKRSALRPHIALADIETAAAMLDRLPTQTVRSEEQIEWQQFSTPLDLAAVALHLAAPTPEDIVLEPSAGNRAALLAVTAALAAVTPSTSIAQKLGQGGTGVDETTELPRCDTPLGVSGLVAALRSSPLQPPSPLCSWLDLGPIAVPAWRRHAPEIEPARPIGSPRLAPCAPSLGIVIFGEDERRNAVGYVDPVEPCGTERRPARDIVDLSEHGGRLEPLGQSEGVRHAAPLPAGGRGCPEHDLVDIPAILQVEEDALDSLEGSSLACGDQQSGEEACRRLRSPRAARMEAQLLEWLADAAVEEIGLCRRALDGEGLVPETLDIGGAGTAARGRGVVVSAGPQSRDLAEHVLRIAAGEAVNEDTVMALPDGEAWCSVLMGWTAAHGVVAPPGAAKSPDDIDNLLGGLEGDYSHGASFLTMRPPPSL